MRNTYVFEVLDTFTPEEVEAFQLFLESPYFNKGVNAEKHLTLFHLWFKARGQLNPPTLQRSNVYEILFPNSPKIEGKLEKLTSEFKKLLHNFLVTRRCLLPQNETHQLLYLAVEMRQRGLADKYRQVSEKIQKITQATGPESMEHYLFRLQAALEAHEWQSTYNNAKGDLNIPEVLLSLEQYYWAQRLEISNRLLLQQKLTILPSATSIPGGVIPELPLVLPDAGALIRIPWKIHAILKNPAPTIGDFEALLHLLQTHENQIGPEHLKEYYTYLRNLCTLLINIKKHTELRPVLFQIYIDNLKRGYFYYEGKIPASTLLNITQIAINAHALPWANEFVEQHKNRIIGENETRDFFRMNKALCLFAEKQFDAALEQIPFDSTYALYHLTARRLELKIYYELDSELLPYKIDAFKMFINRAGQKILSREQQELHAHFINFVRQLSLSPKNRDEARSAQLVRRIEAKNLVAERSWLLEKAKLLALRQ